MRKDTVNKINRNPIIYGVSCVVLTLVVVQLWLLAGTMNAYLDGNLSIVFPAAFASLACLLINIWLLSHFHVLKDE